MAPNFNFGRLPTNLIWDGGNLIYRSSTVYFLKFLIILIRVFAFSEYSYIHREYFLKIWSQSEKIPKVWMHFLKKFSNSSLDFKFLNNLFITNFLLWNRKILKNLFISNILAKQEHLLQIAILSKISFLSLFSGQSGYNLVSILIFLHDRRAIVFLKVYFIQISTTRKKLIKKDFKSMEDHLF